MKLSKTFLALSVFSGLLLSAAAAVKETDWCTIETPDSIQAGDRFDVKVTLKKELPAGEQLKVDIHWFKVNGWGGASGANYVPPKAPAPVGQPTVFSFKSRADLAGLDRWGALVFSAPDGDFKRLSLRADSAVVKNSAVAKPAPAASKGASTTEGGVVRTEFDWATIEVPANGMPEQKIQIKVTLKKELASGEKLKVDMHWFKKAGWGGTTGSNYMQPKDPAPVGQPTIFTATLKEGAELDRWSPFVFAAPDGDFTRRSFNGYAGTIAYDENADPELAKKLAANKKPATCLYKKSWIEILPCDKSSVHSGEEFTMKVKYYIDPTESWGNGTTLTLQPLGPWIDNPDGTYITKRQHVGYSGLHNQTIPGKVGEITVAEFPQTIKKTFEHNALAYRAFLTGADGKNFPWEMRAGAPAIIPDVDGFAIRTDEEGGLFVEPRAPELYLVWGKGAEAGAATFKIYDSEGATVATFTQDLVPGAEGEKTPLKLPALGKRGVFLIEGEMGGKVRCGSYFGIIPDVKAALKGKKTPFGCTNVHTPGAAKTAAKLGMSYCRLFTPWRSLEPVQGEWHLDGLDRQINNLNANGVSPWICLIDPPEWIMPPGVHAPHYMPFPVNEEAWTKSARHLAEHFKGRIWGFEWDNEIVMGDKTDTPVEDYLKFVRIGTTEARAIDPKMRFQIAGGLWPRNFRLDLIRAGICDYIDVSPVHYSSYNSIKEIRDDMAAGGGAIPWDNETAQGFSIWGAMPRLHALQKSAEIQSQWVFRQWPGELVAGAEGIVYFGGEGDAAGNWSYLLDPYTPRPVTATLAMLASKLGPARPVGALHMPPSAIVYLFEREDGKGIAVVMASATTRRADDAVVSTISLPVGAVKEVSVTDYCGNAKPLAAADGHVKVEARPMPVLVEGFDIAPLALLSSLTIASQDSLVPKTTVRVVEGNKAQIKATVANPMTKPVKGTLAFAIGEAELGTKEFSLQPGESAYLVFDSAVGADAAEKGTATLAWQGAYTATETKPFDFAVVRPETLGNLLKNGDFEEAGNGKKPAHWTGNGVRVELPDGGHALAFDNAEGYVQSSQGVKLPVNGATYLYTAWVKTDDMLAGSNVSLRGDGVKGRTLYTPSVFTAPNSTDGAWVYLLKKLDTNPGEVDAGFTPVAKGAKGHALYDNVRLTLFEGSEYAAEAYKAAKAPAIDGDLSDWGFQGPLPLHCANLVTKTGAYKWSPANLSGFAWFTWDNDALYLAVRVTDDKHVVLPNENCAKGDSVVLALHPGNRAPGTDGQAMEWVLSSAHPGGGSGSYTLWRPSEHSAGRKAGHLAKDSSEYGIAIKTVGTETCYELRIPWTELGMTPEIGAKLGLSMRLVDNDGVEGDSGSMEWGLGLRPAWAPSAFGVLTLVP